MSTPLVADANPKETLVRIHDGLDIKSVVSLSTVVIAGVGNSITRTGTSDLECYTINGTNTTLKYPSSKGGKPITDFAERGTVFVSNQRFKWKMKSRIDPINNFMEDIKHRTAGTAKIRTRSR